LTNLPSYQDIKAAEATLKEHADKLGLTIKVYHGYAYTVPKGTPTLYLRSFVPYRDEYVVEPKAIERTRG